MRLCWVFTLFGMNYYKCFPTGIKTRLRSLYTVLPALFMCHVLRCPYSSLPFIGADRDIYECSSALKCLDVISWKETCCFSKLSRPSDKCDHSLVYQWQQCAFIAFWCLVPCYSCTIIVSVYHLTVSFVTVFINIRQKVIH